MKYTIDLDFALGYSPLLVPSAAADMGLPWDDVFGVLHSSRDASGYDWAAMSADQIALIKMRWHNVHPWYTADWDYGLATVAFFCAAIFAVFLLHVTAWFRVRQQKRSQRLTLTDRIAAALRYFSARQFRVAPLGYYAPALGSLVGVAGMIIFVFVLMLSARPYIWPNPAMGHSPPLATRTGWMALGIMPFMIAFAAKANWVTLVTGTSHEKLQVFHRWSAVLMYVTALVHTCLFIMHDRAMGTLSSQWYSSEFFWTGTVALVPQTFLVLGSWSVFRNRYYEIFKNASGLFMAAMLVHIDFTLSSWDYFIATGALYFTSWFYREGRTLLVSRLGLPATVESAGPGLVKLTIHGVGDKIRWAPGQHAFVRVLSLGIHALTTHPFTIVSLPQDKDKDAVMIMAVRSGTTRALARRAADAAPWSTRVLFDGPYGGVRFPVRAHEAVFLCAGGTGATFVLPVLADLVAQRARICRRVELVIAVRDEDAYEWMQAFIDTALKDAPECIAIYVRIFFTCSGAEKIKQDPDDASSLARGVIAYGRPSLSAIVNEAKHSATSVAMIGCGPETFMYDLRNAVADAQLEILDGLGCLCKDLFFHGESYRCVFGEEDV
ncbi:unnamed protein product [Mycena citricolor]|uniref:ferric-chelate reductase (NADPH) n=1 Tax=Mycena citricolor TaxID=2018698 RepID=A0AAD2Q1Q4_9AGAR|nr:unnamed protein product [Mycena citricolor]